MKVVKSDLALEELGLELAHAREQRKEWEAREESARKALIRKMDEANRKGITVSDGTHNIKVTVVKQSRISWDEDKLKKTIGSSMWNKVSKRVLDKALLEAKITEGVLDPTEVAKAAIETEVTTVRTALQKMEVDEDE